MDRKQQYQRVFSHFDGNGDGKISPAELHRCLGLLGGEISAVEAEAMVVLMDSDGDGQLGLDDFVRLIEVTEEEEKVRDLREAFKMYEMKDGSGCITPRSLKRTLNKLGEKKTVDECKSMIARFDLNGDGVLNFEEFMVMMS